ncbi:MAG: hypothetical protein RQ750_17615 [Roseovarius sp.]|nr:hypothetical protein [Roseovarius sp.]
MTTGRTKTDFLSFLDFLSEKGLLAKATAQSRKASANKVFAILDADEAKDVTTIDLDELMYRFSNLAGQNYKPQSLQVYKSRIRSALDDFISYKENPLGFKPALQSRSKGAKKSNQLVSALSQAKNGKGVNVQEHIPSSDPIQTRPSDDILPISLRHGLTVKIAHLPFDLTPAEAKKIANIILAHATET